MLADYDKQPGAKRRHGSIDARNKFKLAAKKSWSAGKIAKHREEDGNQTGRPGNGNANTVSVTDVVAAVTTPVAKAKPAGETAKAKGAQAKAEGAQAGAVPRSHSTGLRVELPHIVSM